MTDHEFREKLREYLDIARQYETLSGMHQRLHNRKQDTKFPPRVSSLDEITKVRDARRELELEMRDINGRMMQLATKLVDLEREIKRELPCEVRYHYAGHEIYVKDGDVHTISEVKEMAA